MPATQWPARTPGGRRPARTPGAWRGARPRVLLALLAAAFGVAGSLGGSPAASAEPTEAPYLKYYVVTPAYQGRPENLTEIAERFLGNGSRSAEILDRNVDRIQPDGAALTDPDRLHAGWVLLLPWDAYGDGLRYGLPPTAPAAAPPAGQVGGPSDPGTPAPANPTPANPTPAARCAGTPKDGAGGQDQWAVLRVAPEHAWPYSRGAGVTVAIVDSGADGSRPELAGRLSGGADIPTGSGRGDVDCLGTGTAMAGIVAGRADGGGAAGMAPDASVYPVRVATSSTAAAETDQASAVEVAVAAGAGVIALGGYVDPTRPAVARAIASALAHDAVVVAGASAAGQAPAPGLLRVAAIDIAGAVAGGYGTGQVDVVAPGVDVASLGISGTGQVRHSGSRYAVAFVAGQAALVRSRFPDLTAAQVVRRIEATADRVGSSAPDARYGWGLINPGEAVTRVIMDEGRRPEAPVAPAGDSGWSGQRLLALVVAVLVALLLLALLALRIRKLVRAAPGPAPSEPATVACPDPVADPARVAGPVAAGGPAGAAEPEPAAEPERGVAPDRAMIPAAQSEAAEHARSATGDRVLVGVGPAERPRARGTLLGRLAPDTAGGTPAPPGGPGPGGPDAGTGSGGSDAGGSDAGTGSGGPGTGGPDAGGAGPGGSDAGGARGPGPAGAPRAAREPGAVTAPEGWWRHGPGAG
ncbi:S8 family serine peptidase [Plantactinospora sp. KBS50]|uniref:S8 family serine peptidase n=1 Tax=Plantactinospora sp. KBS50 TaxID=2024580 RepID=UPI000BAAD3DC|nr:S8 family serine peptidase [Plantactinospora sp. KBS50]ASW55405.1 hypothetical protein CIK06_16370 [Plantactinospora sp. KBS50]